MKIFSIMRMTTIVMLMSIIGLGFITAGYAQTTIAVFRFQYAEPVTSQDAVLIADKLRESFSGRTDATVLESWLVDTMLITQGSPQLMECKEQSCLIAMGYLLVVDYVITGNVIKKGNRFEVKVTVADIKNNSILPEYSKSVGPLLSTDFVSVFSDFPSTILDTKHTGAKKVTTSSSTSSGKNKKSTVLRRVVLGVVVTGLVGGAAGGGYLYSKEKNRDHGHTQGPDVVTVEVPMVGMPKHPSP